VQTESLSKKIKAKGLRTVIMSEDGFDFEEKGSVRLSTLHSSKGLDFPVVLLYLPYLPKQQGLSDVSTRTMLVNLLYVGMTRAMDNLNVFVKKTGDEVVKKLLESFTDPGVKS
jgi:superfamily I DNA/RNA helicase